VVGLLPKGVLFRVARLTLLVTHELVLRISQQVCLLILRFAVFQKKNSCRKQETNSENCKIGACFSHDEGWKLRSFFEPALF
jgi:hypothetical protein